MAFPSVSFAPKVKTESVGANRSGIVRHLDGQIDQRRPEICWSLRVARSALL